MREARSLGHPEEKAALLGKIEATGGRLAVVVQRHGISKSLLYNWRSAWKAATLAARGSAPGSAELIQLGVIADPLRGASAIRMTAGAVGHGAQAQRWRSGPG
jgi:transposase-like protein